MGDWHYIKKKNLRKWIGDQKSCDCFCCCLLIQAREGAASLWQIVFHLPAGKKALLVSDAQDAGYGLNTTDTRILLRVPSNAAEAQLVKVGTAVEVPHSVVQYGSNKINPCRFKE